MPEAGSERVAEVQRLFLRHASLLRGFITGLIPADFDAVEDVLHETFLTATAKAADFAPGSNFPAWARAIARLKALEHLRERRASAPPALGLRTIELLADSAPEDCGAFSERRAALARCLGRLAPKARRILELRYIEGLRPPEIAARLSWQPGAVHVALSRARRLLRDCAGRQALFGGEERP